jgi:hypothetical protein
MSSWIENQQQEAFAVYKRYVSVRLHFGPGSSYDYTTYSGANKITLRAFLAKTKPEKVKFIQLANRLRGISHEEFFFAQARYENLDIHKLLDVEALDIYKDWKEQYGDQDNFLMNAAGELRRFSLQAVGDSDSTLIETVAGLLGSGDDRFIEPLAWILQSNPEIVTDVRVNAESNIIHKMRLERVIKIQKFYSYFCII